MSTSGTNAQLVALVRRAMQDPTQRPLIMQVIREAGLNATNDPMPTMTSPSTGTTPGFGSFDQASRTLGAVGNAMQRATPQTAGAAGAGAVLGMGLGALLRKKKQAAADPSTLWSNPEDYQPDVAQRNAAPPAPGQGPTFDTPPVGVNVPPQIADPDILAGSGMRRGGRVKKAFATGGAEEGAEPPVAKSPREVLRRKPMGMPIPVLHTTIVIAAKPHEKGKPKKKARGGPLKPLKPEALPPKAGPGNGGRPRDPGSPFRRGGHVQVPRGSGKAIRGKRFSGIY